MSGCQVCTVYASRFNQSFYAVLVWTFVPCHTSFAIRAWRAALPYRLRRLVVEAFLLACFNGGFITCDIDADLE
jgi:hypothetical protein